MTLISAIASLLFCALNLQSASVEALYEQALGHYRAKDYAAAVAAASQAVKQDANNAACHHIYGLSLAAVERYSEAEDHLKRAIALKPNVSDYYRWRALAYAFKGQHSLAIIDFNRAITSWPK